MHPLLTRQIQRAGITADALPENLARLLEEVDAAYQQIDSDRRLSERSLELTSQELLERNRELVARNKELDALRQAGLDCIITMNHEGKILEFNPAAEKTFGYGREEVLGRTLADVVVPPQYRQAHREGLSRFLSTGEGPVLGKRIEISAIRRDGTEFPVELAVSVVKIEGRPLFSAYLRDISDRKRAEADARRAEKLAIVASRTDNAVIITDVNGRIEWVNDGFTRISGYTAEEVIGKKPGSVLQGPETDPATVQFIRERLSRGEGFRTEIVNYGKTGRKYWLAIEVQPIYDAQGALRNFMAIESDVTIRKEVERELKQAKEDAEAASRAKSEFLANMSHEIRTPLNGVLGVTDLLLATSLDERQRRMTQIAKSSADALLVVINQILDFSKIEAGKLELEAIDFDLRTIVEEVTEMLAYRAASKGLELAYWIDPKVPTSLHGDSSRIRQILINLVNNAVKFTQKGQVIIKVGLERADQNLCTLRISVIDSGVGIPEARRDRLFKPFSQVDASTTRKYGGTGLGLVICKQVVEMMGGTIAVESNEGSGSTFWFTLSFPAGEPAPRPLAPFDLSCERVLTLAQNPALREIIHDLLASWDVRSDTATDADDAVRRLEHAQTTTPFSILILDNAVPFEQRHRIARSLQQSPGLRKTAVIVLSPVESPESEIAFPTRCETVAKPVRQSRLFDALIRAVAALRGHTAPSECGAPAAPASQAAVRSARILVAEDNEVNQLVASEILSRAGFECEIVGDGRLAVKAIEEKTYDAVLMDCQMPEMDGFQATAAIRAGEASRNGARIPIIALTANAIKGDREQCIAAGMDDYVSKPLDPRHLIATLNRILDRGESEAVKVPTSAPVVSQPPMDMEALLARCMGDAGFRAKLLEKVPDQINASLQKIAEALASGDAIRLARAAHGLKGSAANLSAPHVQRVAAELESLGNSGGIEAATSVLERLREEAQHCIEFARQSQLPLGRSNQPCTS